MSRSSDTRYGCVLSSEYHHDDVCGLEEEGHQIDRRFVEVMEDAADRAPIEVSVFATGCNSCMQVDTTGWFYWVAQGDASRDVMVKYGSEDDDFHGGDMADLLVEVAEQHGVAVDWNGSTGTCVCLGDSRRFTNLEAGDRVERTDRRDDRRGVVVNSGLLDHQPDYRVVVKRGHTDRETVGEFNDKERAQAFADFVESSFWTFDETGEDDTVTVKSRRKPARKSGDNLVLWDGQERIDVVRTSDLRVIEEDEDD